MQHDGQTLQHDYPIIDDPQITETIDRLKRKMQDVSDTFEATKTPIKATKSKKISKKTKVKAKKPSKLRQLFLLVLLLSAGFAVANYVNEAFKAPVIEPVVMQPEPEPELLPAKLVLKTASYELLTSELGKTLEITIGVENLGDMMGMPEQFVIDLVDASNNSLMKWPMRVDGEQIKGRETRNFVTRLIEPPAAFANIRVSMSK